MSEAKPSPTPAGSSPKRSKRLYVYWGVALALLLALGLFSWLVVVPVLKTRAVLRDLASRSIRPDEAVDRLGGPESAVRRLSTFLRYPDCLTGREPKPAPTSAIWARPYKIHAIGLLQYCGRRSAAALRRALSNSSPEVRSEAALALGETDTDSELTVQALVLALKDDSERVRQRAAWALRGTRSERPASVLALAEALADRDPWVCRYAAMSLREMGSGARPAIPALARLLADQSKEANRRVPAAEALQSIGGPAAVRALSPGLRDKDPEVCKSVRNALHQLRSHPDEDRAVRQAAAEALKKIKAAQEKDK